MDRAPPGLAGRGRAGGAERRRRRRGALGARPRGGRRELRRRRHRRVPAAGARAERTRPPIGSRQAVRDSLGRAQVQVHVEPAALEEERPNERVAAAALRVPGVVEAHNITVLEDAAGRAVTLHVRLPGGRDPAPGRGGDRAAQARDPGRGRDRPCVRPRRAVAARRAARPRRQRRGARAALPGGRGRALGGRGRPARWSSTARAGGCSSSRRLQPTPASRCARHTRWRAGSRTPSASALDARRRRHRRGALNARWEEGPPGPHGRWGGAPANRARRRESRA